MQIARVNAPRKTNKVPFIVFYRPLVVRQNLGNFQRKIENKFERFFVEITIFPWNRSFVHSLVLLPVAHVVKQLWP